MALKPTYHSPPSILLPLTSCTAMTKDVVVVGGALLLSLITPMGTGDYRIGKGLGIESEVSWKATVTHRSNSGLRLFPHLIPPKASPNTTPLHLHPQTRTSHPETNSWTIHSSHVIFYTSCCKKGQRGYRAGWVGRGELYSTPTPHYPAPYSTPVIIHCYMTPPL